MRETWAGRLLLNIDAELEVLWIDPSDVEIRDVAHDANSQRRVEMRDPYRISGRVFSVLRRCGQRSPWSSSGFSPFCWLLPGRQSRPAPGCRFTIAYPNRRIAGRRVELLRLLTIVGEVWPPLVSEAFSRNYGSKPRGNPTEFDALPGVAGGGVPCDGHPKVVEHSMSMGTLRTELRLKKALFKLKHPLLLFRATA